jgi:nucleotide-binding universal stress UspA family protein
MKIRHILCATDFSEFSARAVEHAALLAGAFGAELTLAHAYPYMAMMGSDALYFPSGLPLDDATRARLMGALESAARAPRAAGVKTTLVLLEGDPAEEIARRARTVPTDLVVMGTHGRRGFERFVVGSVAGRVVSKAPCAVLTVPRPPEGAPAGAAASYPTIVCATDLWTAEPVLDAAVSVARLTKGRVTALHVVEGLPEHETTARTAHIDWPDFIELVVQDARRRLRQAVARHGTEGEVDELVLCGKAYRDILDVAAARHAGLVVMGVHARNPLQRMFVGSTTHHVLRLATCPVLTVRIPEGQ